MRGKSEHVVRATALQLFVPMVPGITPHAAARSKGSAMDARTARHVGYTISQRCRKKVEEIFGWMKAIGGLWRTRLRGTARTSLCACMVAAAYNPVRMTKLLKAV